MTRIPDKIASPDLASPQFKADPYPFYARLRAEAPVWRTALPDKRAAWLVTRYKDVARVLKDDTLAKDKLNAMDPEQLTKTPWIPGFLKPLERNMLDLDDPDHAHGAGSVGWGRGVDVAPTEDGHLGDVASQWCNRLPREGGGRCHFGSEGGVQGEALSFPLG